MPEIPVRSCFLNADGSLKIVEWARDVGLSDTQAEQLLAVARGVRPTPVARSPATGQSTVSNGRMGADIIRLEAGRSFAPHTHAGDHLLIIIGGQGTITYDGKIYPTHAGQIYMIQGEVPHAVGAITDHVILAIGSPHKKIDAEDRMTPSEYTAVMTDVQELHCLVCDIRATNGQRLHALGCPHCPCRECNPA